MLQDRLMEFVTLWVMIDPIGSLPVYLAVTAHLDASTRRKAAFLAVGVAFLVLLFFIVAGQILLVHLGISLLSFQIAGGIVLFLFALQLIHGTIAPDHGPTRTTSGLEHAIYPLAIPSIAGPGAMLSVVLLTDNSRHDIADQTLTVVVIAIVLVLTLLLFMVAAPISRLIGKSGASIIARIMGMLLAAVAVDTILRALVAWLRLPPLS
jgi:multiple antibiotic resistance protein